MSQVTYRDWVFNCDSDKTRKAYEGILVSGVESCECAGCRNFLVQREAIFPEEILTLFNQLGVNYKRDAEIYHIARMESGLHLYGGWFHFIGSISKQPIGPAKINQQFTIDFLVSRDLAAKSFGDEPLVQIEISAEVPWVLEEEKEPA